MKIPRKAIMLFILVTFCVILSIYLIHVYKYNLQLYRLKQLDREDEKLFNEAEEETVFLDNKIKKIYQDKYKIKYIKAIITAINERQYIGSARKFDTSSGTLLKAIANFENKTSMKLKTVLVIQVHGNHRYLEVFLESARRVVGISQCLLIFAHDFYDLNVHNIISNVHFARVMQMYYPYSIQLHPYRYPGEDVKICEELFKCIFSNERDPIKSQTKLFWWWVVNHVFEHVEVLKKHDGYIYFLEVEQYLSTDLLIMAKKLEQMQPKYCPECHILSLAGRRPLPEQYNRENCSLNIGIWGWTDTDYIKSGIGFNRTTWNEVKRLKKEFCYYNDPTWVNSLKYLASKTYHKWFYMLSPQGPRIFPTNDCTALGLNESQCDIVSTYRDVAKFIKTTSRGLFPYHFTLDFDATDYLQQPDKVDQWGKGGWDDARDREICMFIASNGRRVYY